MLPPLPYASELVFATQTAQSIAKSFRHHAYSSGHLLKALLHHDVGLFEQLEAWGVDTPYLKDWADIRVETFPKAMQSASEPQADDKVRKIMDVADIIRLKLSLDQISPLCALAAMTRPGVAFNEDQLKSFPVTENELLNFQLNAQPSVEDFDLGTFSNGGTAVAQPKTAQGKFKTLHQFCVDKTALAKDGKIDPIIGREGETRQMAEILSRRTKPNVMVVGEPGVGKTALVEGFALKIVNDEVTGHLKESKVLELDVGALVAGASYKGEVEDRLKKIIKEVKLMDKAILFIDEVHMLLDPRGSVGSGAANLLKPELARGEITVIGATTNEEYRKFIEKDEAFNRRFELLRVEEPDTETAIRMLKAILPKYEAHHSLELSSEALTQSVKLAQRYLRERSLPDSAVDLMDRTMAALRLMGEGSEEVIDSLETELKDLVAGTWEDTNQYFQELKWFQSQMGYRLSPILTSKIEDEEAEKEALQSPEVYQEFLQVRLEKVKGLAQEKVTIVEASHIASIVSHASGIPLGKIQSKERERLLGMEEALGKRVIGQNHALKIVSEAVQIARSGLKEPGKPVGSFFFLGPTGTGKTELAKAIASFLFNDESALIRFDMSEFKGETAVNGLIGSNAGYVGYEEGGPLVNKIRKQPYSVVLFDEIEKAGKEVFDIFLQILDEGKVTDRMGKEGDFSNAIILFTSNIGSQHIVSSFEEGHIPEENDLKEVMSQYFRPEFLGRVSNIIPFSPITEDIILRIFDIHLRKLIKLLKAQGIQLTLTDEAKKHIAMAGFNPTFGARPLIGEIRMQLTRPISKMIIKGEAKAGDTLEVGLNGEEELTWETK
ncbi:MAG: ATP-dependent Clp protease ATP-binding subunit [Bacteroidota bacterium]